jgi:hypothetical protein
MTDLVKIIGEKLPYELIVKIYSYDPQLHENYKLVVKNIVGLKKQWCDYASIITAYKTLAVPYVIKDPEPIYEFFLKRKARTIW